MLETDVFHPCELSPDDIAAWRAMQASSAEFGSPLFGPDFARAVGAVRSDARIARFSRHGRLAGFLAYHHRPSGLGRPIGAPFSDYQALVGVSGERTNRNDVMAGARLKSFRFTGLIDPAGVFSDSPLSTSLAYRVVAGSNRQNPSVAAPGSGLRRNYRRYRAKIEREVAGLRLVAHHCQADFEALLEWKRRQIRRTGVQDFLSTGWARALMQRLFETREGDFRGLALSLYVGETQISSHFGVRLGDVFHPWIGASDPDFNSYSPGLIHQWMAIDAMPALELRVYDLGPGFGHWKARFATETVGVRFGLAVGAGLSARYAGLIDDFWRLPAVAGMPATGRLRRRLEQIAVTELTFGGRVRGLGEALGALGRRAASRTNVAERRLIGADLFP